MIFEIVIMIIYVRKKMIDIYKRKGKEYIGSKVFGMNMKVWQIMIEIEMIEEFEVKMMVWGGSNGKKIEKIKKIR